MMTSIGRDLQNIDDDVLRAKSIIKERLCKDMDIIDALNNPELKHSNAEPDEYINVNIFPFIRIPGTQDKVKNYICFSVDDMESYKYNEAMKVQYIQFVVFCHEQNINTEYGMARHDLLGYLIRDIFNWSNIIGLQLKLVYNQEGVTDTNYSSRTLKFEAVKPNMLQKGVMTNRNEFTRH